MSSANANEGGSIELDVKTDIETENSDQKFPDLINKQTTRHMVLRELPELNQDTSFHDGITKLGRFNNVVKFEMNGMVKQTSDHALLGQPKSNTKAAKVLVGDKKQTHRQRVINMNRSWKERCAKMPMLHPQGRIRVIWDCFMLIILSYSLSEIPFTLAFYQDLRVKTLNVIFSLAFVVNSISFIDILVNFRTARYDKYDRLKLIGNQREIARQYLRGWFWLDLWNALPIEMFHKLEEIRILKMFRIFRWFKIINDLTNIFFSRQMTLLLKLIKILILMFLVSHFGACIWYDVGRDNAQRDNPSWLEENGPDQDSGLLNETTSVKYLWSMYWATVYDNISVYLSYKMFL